MKTTLLFTITFLITVLGSINWGFHAIGYNIIEILFTTKKELSPIGKNIYYVFMISAIISLIIFFRQKMYKPPSSTDQKIV